MLGLRRALLALFVLGVLFAGFDVALVLGFDPAPAGGHRDLRAR